MHGLDQSPAKETSARGYSWELSRIRWLHTTVNWLLWRCDLISWIANEIWWCTVTVRSREAWVAVDLWAEVLRLDVRLEVRGASSSLKLITDCCSCVFLYSLLDTQFLQPMYMSRRLRHSNGLYAGWSEMSISIRWKNYAHPPLLNELHSGGVGGQNVLAWSFHQRLEQYK